MPNGRLHDNPLTDLTIHGEHPFPPDIEELLLRINELGKTPERWPLGSNWPFSPLEFDSEKGKGLDQARELLQNFISILEGGRGDEIMVDSLTRKPFFELKLTHHQKIGAAFGLFSGKRGGIVIWDKPKYYFSHHARLKGAYATPETGFCDAFGFVCSIYRTGTGTRICLRWGCLRPGSNNKWWPEGGSGDFASDGSGN